jgi:RNA polymerase-interacting CarD/CdnL/TRCF family regulator
MNEIMAPEEVEYLPGDWVVHRQHGLGQVKSLEEKHIGEKTNTYCKIRTPNVTIWLPVEKMNDEWLRPLASPGDIKAALEVLRQAPKPMSDSLNNRKNRIKKVDTNDTPVKIATLLRDLWALKKEKKTLSQAEEEALRHFTNCFMAEWSVCLDGTMGDKKEEFEALLKIGRAKAVDS